MSGEYRHYTHGLTAGATTVIQIDESSIVLRIETDRGTVVLKGKTEAERPATEFATNQLLRDAGVPVAPLIAYGDEPVAYLVCGWLEGSPLSSASSTSAQRKAGALLRQIHDRGGGPPYSGNQTWEGWMEGWLNHALAWWRDSGGADTSSVDAAWAAFRSLEPTLATRGHHFILFDGRPEHFLTIDDEISGIVDLELARGGDGAMDLGVMGVSDPQLLTEVLTGYGPDPAEAQILDRLVPFYVFLRRLAAAEWKLARGEDGAASHILSLLRADPIPNV